jgi:hypothetical protein
LSWNETKPQRIVGVEKERLFPLPFAVELHRVVVVLANIFPTTDAATDAAFDQVINMVDNDGFKLLADDILVV